MIKGTRANRGEQKLNSNLYPNEWIPLGEGEGSVTVLLIEK